jgi:GT2 family glycosyltransferase
MSHVFTARPRPQASLRSAVALDLGLAVRIEAHPAQRTIFSSAEELPVRELVSELAELVSSLRVRSFALRHELEEVTSALLRNVECGFWPLARRAALDLSGVLALARRRRLADVELCWRAGNAALRIAELCAAEVL